MIRRNTIKKAGTTFAHLALSVTALSGGAHSYYRTQRGFYSPGKEMIAELNTNPLSATAIQNSDWQKNPEPVVKENGNGLELKKTQKARELIIVDSAVQDKHVIFKQARPGVDIVEVPEGKDGMVELMKILSDYSNLDAVHIVSHAESGTLHLGAQIIDQKVLEEDLAGFVAINRAIREGGDLMLYGCDVAKGEEGSDFLEIIKNNTHADVAASTDKTGNPEYGGNWDLEIRKGDIEATPLPESIAMNDFTDTLQPSGTKTFESWNGEYYSDDPSKDWDGFTTYISTPGTFEEVLSGTVCDDDLYVSMYDPSSEFLIRSNPAGASFGVTGLNISTPDNGGFPADEVSIYGYQGSNPTPEGTKIGVDVTSDTGTPIDLTTGITGSFAEITRLRIAADNTANDEVDFCLSSVTFPIIATTLVFTTQPANSTSGSTLATQPVVTAQDDFGNTAVDFTETVTLTETSAGVLSGDVNVAAVDGVATFTDVTYTATTDQESFTLTANDEDGTGSDLPTTDANTVTSDAVATKLSFTTEPAPTTMESGQSTSFTTVPVVSAVDANGTVDTDYSADITLAEVNGTGSATMTATGDSDPDGSTVTITPSGGAATFTDLQITYTASGGSNETFNLQASSGGLTTANSTQLTATVISNPTVSTTSVSTVDATSATLGGEVTDDGGASVSDRGIVWNTSGTPDIDNDNVVSIGTGTGAFSQSVGLLPFGTTIFYRAFATNSAGTAYGADESFTTEDEVSVDLTGSEGWRLLSVPENVSLSTFLGPIWTQGVTLGGNTDAGTPNVYTWSTSTDGNDQVDWQAITDLTNTTLDGGHGVLVQVYADPDYDGPEEDGFPYELSVSGSEYASGVSPTMNSNNTGWTLLGNPFASAVSYNQISPTNLTGILYVWNPNDNDGDANGGTEPDQSTGSWNTWNGSVGDVTGGRIAPFQGFLVQNSTAGSSVTFSQSSKTSTATSFLGKENQVPFVRLELQGRGMQNSAWLEFTPEGSFEKIDNDAWELQPLSSNYALLATQKSDGSLVDIGRYPQASELEIPLVTEATEPGHYSLNMTDFEAAGQTLYLNDLHTGESILLEQGTRYEFTIDPMSKVPADPFVILQNGLKKQTSKTYRFVISSLPLENPANGTPEQFTLEQNYPNPFNPATVIRYQLPVNSEVRLEVFDMAGRQIATLVNGQKEAGSHTVNFDGSGLSSGVYMYRLRTDGRLFTKKLTLIK